ncbi:MAG TPA: TonB family protein [Candidatus Sulfotelmatobacter sp.]|nr:TonB family protein [Candidatus Sulfotelmatobacter sp.]
MKHIKAFLVVAGWPGLLGQIALGTTLLGASAFAGDVRVIANPSVKADSISARELKSLYLEEKNSLNGTHVEPVIERRGPAHEAFLHDYLGQTDDELQKYYQALVFTGRGLMPKTVSSDAEVVAYVARTRGAIGYVDTGASLEGVKTLAIADSSGGERQLVSRVEPAYPKDLQQRSIGGTVRLKVVIAANGSVEHVDVLGGNPILGESAAAAVQKWKYAAAGSRTTMEISVPFDPKH